MNPSFKFEKKYWNKGCQIVAGCDEVGRGCFAGPVFTAVAIFSPKTIKTPNIPIIRDSKKMTALQRKKSSEWIKESCLNYGIGLADVSLINKIGIKKATDFAFRKAIANCKTKIEKLLIDAFYIPYVNGVRKNNQHPIIKGDSISFSIACASIIAKVERDSLMEQIGETKEFKKYDWFHNKGYGTKKHQEAILKHGITKYHRTQFVQTFLKNKNNRS